MTEEVANPVIPGAEKPVAGEVGGAAPAVAPDQPGKDNAPTSFTQEQVDKLIEKANLEVVDRYEGDINKLRSTLMSQQSEKTESWEQQKLEMENQIHSYATRGMDDLERAQYEAKVYADQVGKHQQRLNEMQSQLEATRNMYSYATGFNQAFGVGMEELNFEDPDKLLESGWQKATAKMATLADENTSYKKQLTEMEQRLSQLEGGEKPPTLDLSKIAPSGEKRVVTGQTTTGATGAPSFLEVKKAVSAKLGLPPGELVTDDVVFQMHERGQLDLNTILPSLVTEQ